MWSSKTQKYYLSFNKKKFQNILLSEIFTDLFSSIPYIITSLIKQLETVLTVSETIHFVALKKRGISFRHENDVSSSKMTSIYFNN